MTTTSAELQPCCDAPAWCAPLAGNPGYVESNTRYHWLDDNAYPVGRECSACGATWVIE